MQPPRDYDEYEPRQQIIIREVSKDSGNGSYSKLKDGVFLAVVVAVGGIIWSMNYRLTIIETMVRIIAEKSGVKMP